MENLVEMKGITKLFPGVKALSNINLDLRPGEVHLLLGENGAGKSTLMKILSGVYTPTEGIIKVGEKEYTSLTPHLSQENKIAIIYQELSVINELTIAENLFIGKLPVKKAAGIFRVVDRKEMAARAKELLAMVGFHRDPLTSVSELSISEKQQVEIAKALASDARVLVMDEPTSSLSGEETEQLFTIIRKLKAKGVGIFYISHKMSEMKEIGDRVTVLKDGMQVATLDMKDVKDEKQIISLMVGRELSQQSLRRPKEEGAAPKKVALKVENVTRVDEKVKNVSFELHHGEILGFAGLVGSGRTELMNTIFGAERMKTGKVWLDGKEIHVHSPYEAVKKGMAFITESRRETGFFDNFNICKNIAAVYNIKRTSCKGLSGLIHPKKEREIAAKQKEDLSIRCTGIDQMVASLSGGNQQKVIVGKWLASKANLMIFDEPTRGIDIGAKSEIYHIMRGLADEGKGIIMVSSELPELITLCDRIVVFNKGEIAAIFDGEEATEEAIMAVAAS
ncbi:sugar ABC transporter ATP-binding protein [Zongyangia hominis]|uniref:Sugar ABC transporter ATP-binding protein n=1 Tax=Zongyangia hominis TaxID=2763677 RepID=A0A926EB98_9FIRM|nr:sugar ABC transporter ATP-binding protein [Zongyangia hominis]MBC8570712.1 sugar ABC transporter ATP-binding protein [Zongyangia hominis]